jgi:dolichol-phosphate mannosyltransferase
MLSIIIPTYNEAKNITILIPKIYKYLRNINQDFEIIIVDDNSPDGTCKIVAEIIKKHSKYNVKIIRRTKDKGLSHSVIEGFNKTKGDTLIVMDADLSHPPELLPKMIMASKKHDIIIASRNIGYGESRFSLFRKIVSSFARMLSRPLVRVSDPMSGYFLVKRKVIRGVQLKPKGYKILLEILVKGRYKRNNKVNVKDNFKDKIETDSILELPFIFEKRIYGESKLGFKVVFDYLVHILSLYSYELFSRRKS